MKKRSLNISANRFPALSRLIGFFKRPKTSTNIKTNRSRLYSRTVSQNRSASKRFLRIKNIKKFCIVTGSISVAVIAIVLFFILGSHKTETIVAAADDIVSANNGALSININSMSTTVAEPNASLALPVYSTISISEGVDATVVTTIQTRLMDLDYMDVDEPGSLYDETTKVAVEHFQEQHELPVTGTADQQTYDLLMSDQAKYYTLSIGAKNMDVSELQQRLYELGYIGKDKTTGYFGTDTEAAVKKLQKLNRLSEDGKVGKDTREMLYSEDAVPNMYSYGEQSDEIMTYQKRLKKLGYLSTEPDGTFGDDTKAAVKRFQESSGLVVDGHIGPTTEATLMSDSAQGNALSIGAKGNDVTNVQERLKELGYTKKVTGYFGSDTDAAVKNFQKTNKLTVDGKVGAHTMNTLISSDAKKYKKPASSNNGGSSNNSSGSSGNSSSSNNSSGSSDNDSGSPANISGANVESFISVAESKLGKKYDRGAKGPNSFDCSGFVYWCLNQVGVNQSYMTSGAWAKSSKYTKIDNMGDMQRGDIIVYKGHVAIYAGNGTMIDASSNNRKVVKRSCTTSWCTSRFICAFRVF